MWSPFARYRYVRRRTVSIAWLCPPLLAPNYPSPRCLTDQDEDLPGYDVAVARGRSSRRVGSSSAGTRTDPQANDKAEEEDADGLPDWDDEAELLDDDDDDDDDDDADGADGEGDVERVMVMGRVEDILKRPR